MELQREQEFVSQYLLMLVISNGKMKMVSLKPRLMSISNYFNMIKKIK